MYATARQWAAREFADLDLGDARLDQRFRAILGALARHTKKSLARSLPDPAALKAAYRFFSNPRVHCSDLLAPHAERSAARIAELDAAQTVLLVQDTTFLNFSGRAKTAGLDRIGRNGSGTESEGLILHSTLAIEARSALPLGLVDQRFVDRPAGEKKKAGKGKESARWREALRAVQRLETGAARTVHVCDREADDYALFAEAGAQGAHLLVRAEHNRRLLAPDGEGALVASGYLFDTLAEQRAQGRTEVEVQVNGAKKKFRKATLSVLYRRVTIAPPQGSGGEPLEFSAIMAIERTGHLPLAERLSWVLLTDLEIANVAEAIEKVHWYAARWSIEICQP